MYKGKKGNAIRASRVATPRKLMFIGDREMIHQPTRPIIVIDDAR